MLRNQAGPACAHPADSGRSHAAVLVLAGHRHCVCAVSAQTSRATWQSSATAIARVIDQHARWRKPLLQPARSIPSTDMQGNKDSTGRVVAGSTPGTDRQKNEVDSFRGFRSTVRQGAARAALAYLEQHHF